MALSKGLKKSVMEPEPGPPSSPCGPEHFLPGSMPSEGPWFGADLRKRKPQDAPPLDYLDTTVHVLLCRREKMEHSGPRNTVLDSGRPGHL